MVLRVGWLCLLGSLLGAQTLAVWVWEAETRRLLADPAYELRVVEALKTHEVTTLYLFAEDYRAANPLLTQRGAYRALLTRLHARGFRVEALLGAYPHRSWEFTRPEHDLQARAMLQNVLDYHAAALTGQGFDGLQLDIEPHALDSWSDSTRDALCQAFLDRLATWVDLAHQAPRPLPVAVAIPFWYDTLSVVWRGRRAPMNDHVQGLADGVVLMDYRNHAEGPDGLVALAAEEVAHASKLGRPLLLGLELGDVAPSKVTFRNLGPAALNREMAAARQAFQGQRGFAGFALHHLRTWLDLIAPVPPLTAEHRP